MDERSIAKERAQNLWASFVRSHEAFARSACIDVDPQVSVDDIGGLSLAKDEILTYACAATSPEVYERWGTFPPSGMLLIGEHGTGKSLLAQALATQTETAYVSIDTPRMVIDVVHHGGKVGELIKGWSAVLEELPPLTLYFDELEFSQAREVGVRGDLPVGPIMDFLLEMLDRAIACGQHLVVGATAHPARIRHAFAQPGRLDRVVEVSPAFPEDVVDALAIHARKAEARANRPLFDDIDWLKIVGQSKEAPIGDWVRVLHGVLRRKARAEASQEAPLAVTTADLWSEVERFHQAQRRISAANGGGNYL